MAIQLLINCKVMSYWHTSSSFTARRCIPNVPTYISIDHEHQNGIINSSPVGVIIGDWKYYNHQGLCMLQFKAESLMNITCGLMISQDRNLIRLIGAMLRIRTALYSNLYRPNRLDQHVFSSVDVIIGILKFVLPNSYIEITETSSRPMIKFQGESRWVSQSYISQRGVFFQGKAFTESNTCMIPQDRKLQCLNRIISGIRTLATTVTCIVLTVLTD
ncbi:hypothetical protein H8356DRAFT_1435176 [Neocallimastix lanati (nom. inval.)]|nr:hypothetical protein H8356DRAFT_1435176 [Neocallimastix sp. JGI-2020a]